MPDVPVEIPLGRQIFRFLKEFAEQKVPKQRLLAQQIWSLAFSDLPEHASIEIGEVILASEDDGVEADSLPLLRVQRPKLTPSPSPPATVRPFLKQRWEDPEVKVEVTPDLSVIKNGKVVTERFTDDPGRVAAFERWTHLREVWATAEKPARRAMKVFERLYELRGRIELQSEHVELVLGEGRLRWRRPDGAIDHPVLLQRVELIFDTDHNEFRVVDADRPPELYAPILLGEDGISPEQLHTLRGELEKGGYHPLARSDTSGFLRRVTANLGPRAEFTDGPCGSPSSPDAIMGRDPVLFLRARPPGFPAAFEGVLLDLEERGSLPPGISQLVGVDVGPGPELPECPSVPWGGPPDVLLSKAANAEQIRMARVLERKRTVLVQGPPGTGKSHSIANLIGHLVAQGKRVLVTSHTTKALRVLRDLVDPAIQPLCVSLLENDAAGREQLAGSIKGIVTRLSRSTPEELEEEVGDLAERRLAINGEIARIVDDLHSVRLAEYQPVLFGGESFDPADAAVWVSDHAEGNDWIPGPVEGGAPLPLSPPELRELYETTALISPAEEEEIVAGLPNPRVLLTPDAHATCIRDLGSNEADLDAEFWDRTPAEDDLAAVEAFDAEVREMVEALSRLAPWQRAVVAEGYAGGSSVVVWDGLGRMVREARDRWDRSRALFLDRAVDVVPAGSREELGKVVREIQAHVEAGKSLGSVRLLLKGRWKEFLRTARVNGTTPSKPADFRALAAHLDIIDGRDRLATRWSRQAVPVGLPQFGALPDPVEPALTEYADQFPTLLTWWGDSWSRIEERARAPGFKWGLFRAAAVAADNPMAPFERDAMLLSGPLRAVTASRAVAIRKLRAERLVREATDALAGFSGPVCAALRAALLAGDHDQYDAANTVLDRLRSLAPVHARRKELLEKIDPVAPSWAMEVRGRTGVHGDSDLPGDPVLGWRWTQLRQEIARRASLDERVLAERLAAFQSELRGVTAELIDRKAWLGQLRRVDLRARQALNGWAQLRKKIGRGTGKRAPALEAQARKTLAEAQVAVPVWIMPLSRVAESVNPVRGSFDVVIIDEASQCDIMGLLAWYLADQVVVVGDDKQVSPMAVGQRLEGVQRLIDNFLHDIPNRQLYDGTTSLYDLAQQCFGGTIRLREHFRCMPDIIEFSNELSYDYEILPLRNPQAAPVPHVVEHVVRGSVRDGKTNHVEAVTVAALIGAVVEHPRNPGRTLGAISLLGDEQAHLIWSLAARVVDPAELERRRFVAGNSAQFQGDERDHIFLSLVDASTGGLLPMRQEEYLRQRYNVAASRARDQLWLVHSLDPGRDLKPGDLRRHLIEYVRAPGARGRAAERAAKRAESPFEVEVIKRLSAAGYAVESQVKVGGYRIDVVVRGRGGEVAVECDGARYHPPEKIPDDLARQAILERCGWRFVRIRSTAFFSDRDRTMRAVFDQLRELGVEPDGFEIDAPHEATDPYIAAIRRRAAEIMREQGWLPEIADLAPVALLPEN